MTPIETLRSQLKIETRLVTLKTADGKPIRRATAIVLRFPSSGVVSLTFTERLSRRAAIVQLASHLARQRSRDDKPAWSANFVEAVRGMN